MLPETTSDQRQPPNLRTSASVNAPVIALPPDNSERAFALSQQVTPSRADTSTLISSIGRTATRSAQASDESVGLRIRAARKAQGKTLKELAYVVGVTGAQLHRYEVGATRIAASRLIAIAQALNVSPDVFLTKDNNVSDIPNAPHLVSVACSSADTLVELIQHFSGLDAKQRSALLTIARLMTQAV